MADYWFLDATHWVLLWTPMFGWLWTHVC